MQTRIRHEIKGTRSLQQYMWCDRFRFMNIFAAPKCSFLFDQSSLTREREKKKHSQKQKKPKNESATPKAIDTNRFKLIYGYLKPSTHLWLLYNFLIDYLNSNRGSQSLWFVLCARFPPRCCLSDAMPFTVIVYLMVVLFARVLLFFFFIPFHLSKYRILKRKKTHAETHIKRPEMSKQACDPKWTAHLSLAIS